jgi:hypothetical protein
MPKSLLEASSARFEEDANCYPLTEAQLIWSYAHDGTVMLVQGGNPAIHVS